MASPYPKGLSEMQCGQQTHAPEHLMYPALQSNLDVPPISRDHAILQDSFVHHSCLQQGTDSTSHSTPMTQGQRHTGGWCNQPAAAGCSSCSPRTSAAARPAALAQFAEATGHAAGHAAHVSTLHSNLSNRCDMMQRQQQQQDWGTVPSGAVSSCVSSYWGRSASGTCTTLYKQHSHTQQVAVNALLPTRPAAANSSSQHQQHCSSRCTTSCGCLVPPHVPPAADLAAAAAGAGLLLLPLQQQAALQSNSVPSGISSKTAGPAAAPPALDLSVDRATGFVGRWSGPVAVLDTNQLGSQGPAWGAPGCSLGLLQCDEELLSCEDDDGLDNDQQQQLNTSKLAATAGAGMQQQQHLHQQQSHYKGEAAASAAAAAGSTQNAQLASLMEESGSTCEDSDNCRSEDMHDEFDDGLDGPEGSQAGPEGSQAGPDVCATTGMMACQSAAAAAAAPQQSVSWQVSSGGHASMQRHSQPATAATSSAAAGHGTVPLLRRLLDAEVSVYPEGAAASLTALDQANMLMAQRVLPDGITYMPVSPDSFMFKAGAAWQFPAFVVCLGSSYMHRMMARLPHLAMAALTCPGFEDNCSYLPGQVLPAPCHSKEEEDAANLAALRSLQATCLFIATKVADQVHALGLLRFMLSSVSVSGGVVSQREAVDVEARCLDALGWRLGPFFLEDDLQEGSGEL